MHSIFSTLFLLAVPALASPIESRQTGTQSKRVCRDAVSQLTSWDFEDFHFHSDYIFSTPAHQNSWGYLSFNVTNPILENLGEPPLSCTFQSSRLSDFFYETDIYKCEGSDVSAEVTYDRPSGNLTFSQSWYCYDQPQWPARYTAKGKTIVNTECTDSGTKVNENWQQGQTYSERYVECEKTDFSVAVSELSAVA
jgi:hypothetical protein